MIEKDKSLTKEKKNIFKRFFAFIKSFFKKDIPNEAPALESDPIEEEVKQPVVEEVEVEREHIDKEKVEENYQKIKDKFFERYNQYKSDEVSVKDLSDQELLMAQEMLAEENTYLKDQTLKDLNKNQELQEQINSLEKQVKMNQE